jgi:hypothetical protein
MPRPAVPPAAETVDELRERLLQRYDDLVRDLPHLEQQYRQRLVSDQGIVHDYLHGKVGLHVYLRLGGSGVAPAAEYCLAIGSDLKTDRLERDVCQIAPDEADHMLERPWGVDDWADQAVTVETGQLMERPQFLCPSRVRLYRLDDAESALREVPDSVLLLEPPRVIEHRKLHPMGFTGTINKRDLVGSVVERGPHVADGSTDTLGPQHQVRARAALEEDLAPGIVRVTLGFNGIRLRLTKVIDLGLERFGFFIRPAEALPSIWEWAGHDAGPSQVNRGKMSDPADSVGL